MISDEERSRRIAAALAEEADKPERYFWLSFADGSRPEGEQFLGATIVEARGLATATQRAHQLGINPGGEIMSAEFGPEDIGPPPCFPREHFDFMFEKLRSRAEIDAFGIPC